MKLSNFNGKEYVLYEDVKNILENEHAINARYRFLLIQVRQIQYPENFKNIQNVFDEIDRLLTEFKVNPLEEQHEH